MPEVEEILLLTPWVHMITQGDNSLDFRSSIITEETGQGCSNILMNG